MSIFKRRGEEEIDLSDQALLADAETTKHLGETPEEITQEENGETKSAGPNMEEGNTAEERASLPTPGSAAQESLVADLPDQETVWRQATHEVVMHWPQMQGDIRKMIGKMAEISARYGDATLWQRAPGGIMREAAMELYGVPGMPEQGVFAGAVREAHAQGMKAGTASRKAKAGLGPPQVSRSALPPLSEEEKIIREMMKAKKGSIF